MMVRRGATRIVFVFRRFVIKVPNVREWRLFLNGLLANMQERLWSGQSPFLARVILGGPAGFFLVMERAVPFLEGQAAGLCRDFQGADPGEDFRYYLLQVLGDEDYYEFLMSDCKASNWGWVGKRLVKIDYGN